MKNLTIKFAALAFVSALALTLPYTAKAEVVTGGIGEGGIAAMEAQQSEYSFKATFSGNGGIYLSNVGVTINDRAGNPVESFVTEGPIVLANLAPGRYSLDATAAGQTKRVNFTVPANGLRSVAVRLPVSDNSYTATTGQAQVYTANGRSVKGAEPYYDPDFQATGYYDPAKDTTVVIERSYYPNSYYLTHTDWHAQQRGHDSGFRDNNYIGDDNNGDHAARGRDAMMP